MSSCSTSMRNSVDDFAEDALRKLALVICRRWFPDKVCVEPCNACLDAAERITTIDQDDGTSSPEL